MPNMKFLVLFFFSFLIFHPFNSFTQTFLSDYLDAAVLFRESGEYNKAVGILKSAKAFNKNSCLVRYRGELEFLTGHSEKALAVFNSLKSKNWRDFLYLGLIYEDLDKKDLAIANYSKSLKLHINTIAYFRLGKIYRGKADYAKAAEYFSRLIKFDSSLRLAYYYLGECLERSGSYRPAYKFLAKAINFYPEVEIIREKLRAVKEKIGDEFFIAEARKKEERRKKVKLIPYSPEVDIPLVKVGLADNLKMFSFFCGSKFRISNGEDSFLAQADKFYTFTLKNGKIILGDYQGGRIHKSFTGSLKISSIVSEEKKSPFYVLSLISGKGNFWHKERDRAYRGDLEVIIKGEGLNLINTLSVEEYLYGVLSAEMSAKAHPQALQAQAVAARTFAFRNLKRHKKEGFDFCSQVHCQVYQGIRAETPSTKKAVKDTRGEIIVYEDKPIEVLYHANCGGCLAADVFGSSDYLIEKVDTFDVSTLLSVNSSYNEENWFYDPQEVFCFKSNESKFRWQRVYDAEDFFIAFGKKIEDLKGILLKEKGDCFHYKEIEIIFSDSRQSLKGDLTIRNYFDHLRSSAFKIERKLSARGTPAMLFFWGAGFGHGAGMCQDGAVGMAEDGYNYHRILNHYFPNTKIKKLY